MPFASIKKIDKIEIHPNADSLVIAKLGGWNCIVKKNQFQEGELVCFIETDVVLPEKNWSAFYRSKSSRTKAIKLRSIFSEGIVEKLQTVEYTGPIEEGRDISNDIGVIKFEPPIPRELNAKGLLPLGILKTDEERFQNLEKLPIGESYDATLKLDGTSFSCYYKDENNFGVCGRTLEYKLDCINNYTVIEKKYDIINKLREFNRKHGVAICLRGEIFGGGVQKGKHNPHSQLPLDVAFFSVWLIDERRYARKGDEFYFINVCAELGLPTVPLLESGIFEESIIKKYSEDLTQIDGKNFEGVVVNTSSDSFKIINKYYDSLK